MSSNKQINTLFYNSLKDEFHEISRLSVRKSEKDLYFIDKSNDIFHLSIHKDGKVFISPQSNKHLFKPIKLFEFEWSDIDIDMRLEKSFLFYVPTNVLTYPIKKRPFKKDSNTIIYDMNPENLLIKIFMIHKDVDKPILRNSDLSFKITKLESKGKDGSITTKEHDAFLPLLKFNHYNIRYDIDKMNFTADSNRNFRFLFLYEPTPKMNVVDFISTSTFVFDSKKIKEDGFHISEYEHKQRTIKMIAY